jgi:hypothetical protein
MHHFQTAWMGAETKNAPPAGAQVGRREIPSGAVLSALTPPVLRVYVVSLAAKRVERALYQVFYVA